MDFRRWPDWRSSFFPCALAAASPDFTLLLSGSRSNWAIPACVRRKPPKCLRHLEVERAAPRAEELLHLVGHVEDEAREAPDLGIARRRMGKSLTLQFGLIQTPRRLVHVVAHPVERAAPLSSPHPGARGHRRRASTGAWRLTDGQCPDVKAPHRSPGGRGR